jgi:PTS system ascorbate-specific IIA component
MSVGLLIVTHGEIGTQLMRVATDMLGASPLEYHLLEVMHDTDPDSAESKARKLLADLDSGDGVLVLTDIFGSTPSNIANRLLDENNVRVVAGVNLPMLVRVLNYPRLNLEQLEEKATSGGTDGVMVCRHRS